MPRHCTAWCCHSSHQESECESLRRLSRAPCARLVPIGQEFVRPRQPSAAGCGFRLSEVCDRWPDIDDPYGGSRQSEGQLGDMQLTQGNRLVDMPRMAELFGRSSRIKRRVPRNSFSSGQVGRALTPFIVPGPSTSRSGNRCFCAPMG